MHMFTRLDRMGSARLGISRAGVAPGGNSSSTRSRDNTFTPGAGTSADGRLHDLERQPCRCPAARTQLHLRRRLLLQSGFHSARSTCAPAVRPSLGDTELASLFLLATASYVGHARLASKLVGRDDKGARGLRIAYVDDA